MFLLGVAGTVCSQTPKKLCPLGALGCNSKTPQRITTGCYGGFIVEDGQGNDVCNLEADLSRLNFYTLGRDRGDGPFWPLFGYTKVIQDHPTRPKEDSTYAIKSIYKNAAESMFVMYKDGGLLNFIISCYKGYPAYITPDQRSGMHCIQRPKVKLLQQAPFPLTINCEIGRGENLCYKCKKGYVSGGNSILQTRQCLLLTKGQADMVGCRAGEPDTDKRCQECENEEGWLPKASDTPVECYKMKP